MPVERFLCALQAQGWGMNIFIYVLLLDINCQHLGNICHLEGFWAPFECWVWEHPLGKFLGRHVPRWTNSTKDNFPLYKFQKGQVPNDWGPTPKCSKIVPQTLLGVQSAVTIQFKSLSSSYEGYRAQNLPFQWVFSTSSKSYIYCAWKTNVSDLSPSPAAIMDVLNWRKCSWKVGR